MKKTILRMLLVMVAAVAAMPSEAEAVRWFARRGPALGGEGGYIDPQWTTPHTLVVPPTARWQMKYGSGVAETTRERIRVGHPGTFGYEGGIPAPVQPSHTDQLGTYYLRFPR